MTSRFETQQDRVQMLRMMDERIKRLEQESDDLDLRVRYIVNQVEIERARVERQQRGGWRDA